MTNIKIGTFNIQHGRFYEHYLRTGEEQIRLDGVADVIRSFGVEICGLNEVRNQEGCEGLCNQARVIADALGYHFFFAPAIEHRGGTYGNAIVSKYPIVSAHAIPIPSPRENRVGDRHYEDRVLLVAEVLCGERTVTFLICHFGLNIEERESAVRGIREELALIRTPVVLMGDFNLTPTNEYYARLAELLRDTAEPKGEPLTFPSDAPRSKIDYVFVSDSIGVGNVTVPALTQSDHRPYFVEITV